MKTTRPDSTEVPALRGFEIDLTLLSRAAPNLAGLYIEAGEDGRVDVYAVRCDATGHEQERFASFKRVASDPEDPDLAATTAEPGLELVVAMVGHALPEHRPLAIWTCNGAAWTAIGRRMNSGQPR